MDHVPGQLIGKLKVNNTSGDVAGEPRLLAARPVAMDFKANPVVVVIPAYNEERFIGSVVLKLLKNPLQVIVVDDGSSDDTAAIAQAAGATVISHKRNQGKGRALSSGIRLGRQQQPAAIVMIDADGQHLPEQLAEVVRPVLQDQVDIVVGSRYLQDPAGIPRHRRLGHWFFNWLTRAASGVKVSDSQSGYRALSPRAYNADLFLCSDFSVESEMQFLARQHGLRVAEVPVTIRYTDEPKRPVWRQGLVVLIGILRLTGQFRPLLFFGLPGLLLMLLGLGAAWAVQRFEQECQIAIGKVQTSLLITMIGLISLSTAITIHTVRGLLVGMLQNRQNTDAR